MAVMKPVSELIEGLCLTTDGRLWKMKSVYDMEAGTSGLVYPLTRRAQTKRISEQEARFAFVESILNQCEPLAYSVESPTRSAYQFKGRSRKRAAQTDLTLFVPCNDTVTAVNVEFKFGLRQGIGKDLEKLLTDEGRTDCSLWFHLLESADSGTLTELLGKVGSKLKQVLQTSDGSRFPLRGSMVFHICVVKQQFSLGRTLDLHRVPIALRNGFFKCKVEMKRTAPKENQPGLQGWVLRRA